MGDRNLEQGRGAPDTRRKPGGRKGPGPDLLAVSVIGFGLLLTLAWIVFLAVSLARMLGAG